MKERKSVGAWIFFGICIFCALGLLVCESIPGFFLMLLVSAAALPVSKVNGLWERVLGVKEIEPLADEPPAKFWQRKKKKEQAQRKEQWEEQTKNTRAENKSRRRMKTVILAVAFFLAFSVGSATVEVEPSAENTDSYGSSVAGSNVSSVLGADNSDAEDDTEEEATSEQETLSGESSAVGAADAETTIVSETTTVAETATEAQTTAEAQTTTVTQTTTEKKTEAETTTKKTVVVTSFSVSDVPDYSGSAYVVVNNNIPYFTESDYTTEAFETYSDLDSLGRCGVAYANICPELMPTQERESISSVTPTGWVNNSYSFVDGGYVYNRCHLIGFQLAGENANEKNLITGTRYLNIEGMLPFENMVNDYVDETENHVLYRVTPIFEGNNLVASGVLMEGWSVEDDGDGICFCVYAYNVQPGVIIDYATGKNEASGEYATEAATTTEKTETTKKSETTTTEKTTEAATEAEDSGSGTTYILNTNSHKFHYPDCYSAARISDKNREEYTGDREDLIAQGYEPCKNCNP